MSPATSAHLPGDPADPGSLTQNRLAKMGFAHAHDPDAS